MHKYDCTRHLPTAPLTNHFSLCSHTEVTASPFFKTAVEAEHMACCHTHCGAGKVNKNRVITVWMVKIIVLFTEWQIGKMAFYSVPQQGSKMNQNHMIKDKSDWHDLAGWIPSGRSFQSLGALTANTLSHLVFHQDSGTDKRPNLRILYRTLAHTKPKYL